MTTNLARTAPWGVRTVVSLVAVGLALVAAGGDEPSDGPERFSADSDPVSVLAARLQSGEMTLSYDSVRGYLPSLLEALDIPTSSQGLVFSRTSLQTDRVAPWAPRALYFNDDVYVGWVQDSPIIEIASIDPLAGSLFYTLGQQAEGPPRFEREGTTCLMCHESGITEGVPGLIMRSVLADRLGYPVTDVHQGQTTNATPLPLRWGGWYVTGTHGETPHSGNRRAPDLNGQIFGRAEYLEAFDMNSGGNITDLSSEFDVTAYLEPTSDIVALLVLTHQVKVHNLLSLVHREGTRSMGGLATQKGSRPSTGGVRSVAAVDRLVRAMLFVGEVEFTSPVRGTSTFTVDFEALGPRDPQGRSLRDFDLDRRIFRYPLSFLVYSDAFDALPEFARNHVFDRLAEVLTTETPDPDFAHLDTADRTAILEILRDTKPGFAARLQAR